MLAAGDPGSPARREAVDRLDTQLRDESHALNPGTTADLTAAALFIVLLEHTSGVKE